MSAINDGGPAFPVSYESNLNEAEGMTLRDWFAGQALAGLMADPSMGGSRIPFAELAYNYADAMLKAREAKP